MFRVNDLEKIVKDMKERNTEEFEFIANSGGYISPSGMSLVFLKFETGNNTYIMYREELDFKWIEPKVTETKSL